MYADGGVYDGMWSTNEMNGLGTYTWPDGKSYTGQWVDNNMHG